MSDLQLYPLNIGLKKYFQAKTDYFICVFYIENLEKKIVRIQHFSKEKTMIPSLLILR